MVNIPEEPATPPSSPSSPPLEPRRMQEAFEASFRQACVNRLRYPGTETWTGRRTDVRARGRARAGAGVGAGAGPALSDVEVTVLRPAALTTEAQGVVGVGVGVGGIVGEGVEGVEGGGGGEGGVEGAQEGGVEAVLPPPVHSYWECSASLFDQRLLFDKYLHPETPFRGLYLCGEDGLFGGVLVSAVCAWVTALHVVGPWGVWYHTMGWLVGHPWVAVSVWRRGMEAGWWWAVGKVRSVVRVCSAVDVDQPLW